MAIEQKASQHPVCIAQRSGLTLIETIVVVVILAIAAAIVIPMTSSASSLQARAAADMVYADIEYMRSLAMTHGQVHQMVFDTANESYQIQDQSGNAVSHPVNQGKIYEFVFPGSRLGNVDIVSVDFDGTSTLAVNYLSIPYSFSGSYTKLGAAGTIVLRAGGLTRTVLIEPETANITIN